MLIYQSSKGYCYNSDSIFLAKFISLFHPKGDMLDVGCGIGVLSLILSKEPKLCIAAIDKQRHMIDFARQNFKINGIQADIYLDDFRNCEFDKKFDIVISNPPFYSPSVIQSEDEILNTARYSSHLPIDDFFKKVHMVLKPQGRFFFCYDAKQIVSLIESLKKYHLNIEAMQFVYSKLSRDSKLLFIYCRHNSKSDTKVLSPLIVFGEDDTYTKEAKEAFTFASLHSIKAKIDD